MVSWVNCDNFGSLAHIDFIYEICNWLKAIGKTKVIFKSRASNFIADSLAKEGSNNCGDYVHIMDS